MTSPLLSDRVRRWLVVVVVAVMTVFGIVYTIHKATAHVPASILQYLHINTELAFAAWFNAALLLTVALLAATLAYGAHDRPTVRAWTVVALATAYLSLDEATALHETAGRLVAKVPALDIGTFHWVVPGAALAVVGVVVLLWVTKSLEVTVRRRLGIALTGYLVGALGVEIITGLLIRAYADVWVVVNVAQPGLQMLEESLEMLACIYAIWALLRHLEEYPDARPTLAAAQA